MSENSQAQNWSNYWKGRTAAQSGEVLVGAGIENDVDLQAFWDALLKPLSADITVLDLACGAGSVARRAHGAGIKAVTGVDISEGAIQTLKENCPDIIGVISAANATGLKAGDYDLIVSQFGFEYAGAKQTVEEISRLLKPGGTFVAISHKTGSAIEMEVSQQRDEAQAIIDTGFVETAKKLFETDKQIEADSEFTAALEKFRPAQDKLLEMAKTSGGLAAHLYSGTQTLFSKRINYNLEDIFGWLDGMANEIVAYYGRMQSMMDAALSEQDMKDLRIAFESHELVMTEADVLKTGFVEDELGWIIRASKPG